jgi:uncharacterized tellurite resistance protein B-like protein
MDMRPIERLHYAIGLLAFAVARADGNVQKAERQKFQDIVAAGLMQNDHDFDVSGIIFQIMDKEQRSTEDAYVWAMHEIETNSHYVSPEMKCSFLKVMELIAIAYPPVTLGESMLIEKFKEQMEKIHGDPIYYASKM